MKPAGPRDDANRGQDRSRRERVAEPVAGGDPRGWPVQAPDRPLVPGGVTGAMPLRPSPPEGAPDRAREAWPRPPWGLLDLVGTAVGGAVLGVALVVVSVVLAALLDLDLSGSAQFGVYATELYAGFLVAAWGFGLRRHGAPWRAMGFRPVGIGTLLAMVPLGVVLLIVNVLVLIPVSSWLGDEDAADGGAGPLAEAGLAGVDILWLALPIVVMAPVVEEVLFRGLLYRYLRGRFGRRRVGLVMAVVVSAAIFGVLHVVVPPIFVMGLVLAGFAERFDSLYPGMVLHAVNNGLVVLAIALVATYG